MPDKIVCKNKKAYSDYHIEGKYEAGIVLVGSEVKSIRDGRVSLSDSYAEVENGELHLIGSHISEYPFANNFNHDPKRPRKLLMHRQEIKKLAIKVAERGYTLIPLSLYLKNGKVKVELGLARGKRQYDKRESIRKRDQNREIERGYRHRNR